MTPVYVLTISLGYEEGRGIVGIYQDKAHAIQAGEATLDESAEVWEIPLNLTHETGHWDTHSWAPGGVVVAPVWGRA